MNLDTTGNTVSSTVMIGLKDCLDCGLVHEGMNVMVTGFGGRTKLGGNRIEIFKLFFMNKYLLDFPFYTKDPDTKKCIG